MLQIITKRFTIYPFTNEQMQEKIDAELDEGLKIAFSEMLTGCMEHPEQRLWYAIWAMQMNSEPKAIVGDLSFKGLNNGVVEIGYGIKAEYEGQGYMTEAVTAMAEWASKQPGVRHVEAETDLGNIASQRVLHKAGFIESGVMGVEGPRYLYSP